jgi:hypothetical protein
VLLFSKAEHRGLRSTLKSNENFTTTGQWPGEDDCARLGFYVNGDPDLPDLNRLFTDCVWDADTQRWERKQ